jgi:excisionase family DNA binding protein
VKRFLTREQVAEELNLSMSQTYALIRRGEIRAAKIGGRGDWRIGRDDLEAFIERAYNETAQWIGEHPIAEDEAWSTPTRRTQTSVRFRQS